ncbi:unannotated protein [freshwater metagenome]|uniref:Unannotated protein n=1 Tax=freshwater metagenome TaxID=449393 RepID=A0A6J6D0J4_9ZZZZ
MSHAHNRVVDRVDQRVERVTVGAHDDEVRERPGREGDFTTHEVVERDVFVRHAQPERGLPPFGSEGGLLLKRQVAIGVVITHLGVAPGGTVTFFDFFGRRKAFVHVPGRNQLLDDVSIDVHAFALAIRRVRPADVDSLIPGEAEPRQRVNDLVVAFFRVACGIRVFDSKDERATRVTRIRPVEQRRANQPHVRGACRRGAETHANICAGRCGHGVIRHESRLDEGMRRTRRSESRPTLEHRRARFRSLGQAKQPPACGCPILSRALPPAIAHC